MNIEALPRRCHPLCFTETCVFYERSGQARETYYFCFAFFFFDGAYQRGASFGLRRCSYAVWGAMHRGTTMPSPWRSWGRKRRASEVGYQAPEVPHRSIGGDAQMSHDAGTVEELGWERPGIPINLFLCPSSSTALTKAARTLGVDDPRGFPPDLGRSRRPIRTDRPGFLRAIVYHFPRITLQLANVTTQL